MSLVSLLNMTYTQLLCHAEGEDYLFQTGVFGAGNRPIPGFNIRILNSILFFNDQVVENPRIETLSVRVSTVPIGRLVFSGSPGLDVIEGTITDDDGTSDMCTREYYSIRIVYYKLNVKLMSIVMSRDIVKKSSSFEYRT